MATTPPQADAVSLRTVVLDGGRLLEARKHIRDEDDGSLRRCLALLRRRADQWLTQGPWSVMEKTKMPPSGDMHDYTSQAPYWWPSPTPDRRPYVQRDGERNPEVLEYPDRVNVEKVVSSSTALCLAWFYTGHAAYSKHAADILRTWFIIPETRMNPNLNHAQLIPFANEGRHIGIIDLAQSYTTLLDMAKILESGGTSGGRAPGWTAADMDGFLEWNRSFLKWLTESEFGKAERAEKNNHGVFAGMTVSAIALFVGDTELVKKEVMAIRRDIDESIKPDGSLPLELTRTRSWHYTNFALLPIIRAAMIAQKVGVDLWKYEGTKGQSISKAIDFIIPTATGDAKWKFPELQFCRFAASDLIRAAADAGHEQAGKAIERVEMPPDGDFWPLRPAPEQLDPVKARR